MLIIIELRMFARVIFSYDSLLEAQCKYIHIYYYIREAETKSWSLENRKSLHIVTTYYNKMKIKEKFIL